MNKPYHVLYFLLIILIFGCNEIQISKDTQAVQFDVPANTTANNSSEDSTTPEVESFDCTDQFIKCIPSEYATIQQAADSTQPGDTVVVSPGNYSSFQITRTGEESARIRYVGVDNPTINSFSTSVLDGIRINSRYDDNYFVNYITIEGFNIEDPDGRCISVRGAVASRPTRGQIIKNIICTNSTAEGFYLSQMSNSLVQNNIIDNAGNSASVSSRTHGIYLSNGGTDNNIIRGNIITRSGAAGIHHNGDANIDAGGGTDGIISGLLVENNIIAHGGQNAFNMDGVRDSVYRNNLAYGNAKHAMRDYAIDASRGAANITVVNNTFIISGNDNCAFRTSQDDGGHILFNNIFVTDGDCFTDIESNANSYLNNNFNFTASQAQNIFINMAAEDFRLNPSIINSYPLIRSFSGVDAPTFTIENSSRASNGPVGCY